MEAEPAKALPTGPQWIYEIKFDGYRAEVLRESERVLLCSRRGNQLNRDFPDVVKSLQFLFPGTVIDGEIAALDSNGRPSFTLMQNRQTEKPHIVYFAFDILMHIPALPSVESRTSQVRTEWLASDRILLHLRGQ